MGHYQLRCSADDPLDVLLILPHVDICCTSSTLRTKSPLLESSIMARKGADGPRNLRCEFTIAINQEGQLVFQTLTEVGTELSTKNHTYQRTSVLTLRSSMGGQLRGLILSKSMT